MPMPSVKVLMAFLEDYFKLASEIGITRVFRNLSEERKRLLEEYNARFSKAQTVADWANAIIQLGVDARIAQNQKYTPGDSELALTLNAMRSYAISTLREDPTFSLQYEAEIRDRLTILNTDTRGTRVGQNDLLSLRAQFRKDMKDGVTPYAAQAKLESALLALADLGHEDSLIEVLHLKLKEFSYYIPKDDSLPSDIKGHVIKNYPLCYQTNYQIMFYMKYTYKYHPITDDLKIDWNIPQEKEEFFRYSEFLEQVEKSDHVPKDNFSTQLATRKVRGHNFPPPSLGAPAQSPQIPRPNSKPEIALPPVSSSPTITRSSNISSAPFIPEETTVLSPLPPRSFQKSNKPGYAPPTLFSQTEEIPIDVSPSKLPTLNKSGEFND